MFSRTPEITGLTLRRAIGSPDDDFDLFYEEKGSRQEREIGWAGDGIQIWVQALYHLWVQREAPVVILDEPDVFLHPDLQRRLARTLFAGGQQTVLATHSIEVLAEADPGSTVWIDRSRRTAERPKGDGALAMMGRRLGSGYELGVGKALRTSVALFVEGDDAPVLARLARQLNLSAVASSDSYATVPLGGFTRHSVASAFAETMDALGSKIRTFVILDGDLRPESARRAEVMALEAAGATVHIWRRRELENYLIVPSAIAKAAGISLSAAEALLNDAVEQGKDEALIALQSACLDEKRVKGSAAAKKADRTILNEASQEFGRLWTSLDGPLSVIDAKRAISSINAALQQRRARTINAHSLARSVPFDEVPTEVGSVLRQLEELIRG